MGRWGKVTKTLAKADPSRIAPKGTGTTIGRIAGGTIGGSIGGVAGAAVGQNIGRMIGDGAPGIGAMMKGNIFGKTKGPEAQPGPADVRPELSPWQGMDQGQVRSTDLFRPAMFNAEAMQTGLSALNPWQQMALKKQEAEQSKAMDEAARQQSGALAGARSSMAMRGGLRGGAAERLAASGAQNLAQTMQQQRQVGAIQRGDIGLRGAEMAKDIAQGNVAAQTEGQARNIQAALAELGAKRGYDVSRYQEQMKGYAAEKTGQALGKEPKPTLLGDPLGYIKSQF